MAPSAPNMEPEKIAELTRRRDDIDRALADPANHEGGTDAGELMNTRGLVERDLAAAESRWIEASEALERAKGAE